MLDPQNRTVRSYTAGVMNKIWPLLEPDLRALQLPAHHTEAELEPRNEQFHVAMGSCAWNYEADGLAPLSLHVGLHGA